MQGIKFFLKVSTRVRTTQAESNHRAMTEASLTIIIVPTVVRLLIQPRGDNSTQCLTACAHTPIYSNMIMLGIADSNNSMRPFNLIGFWTDPFSTVYSALVH